MSRHQRGCVLLTEEGALGFIIWATAGIAACAVICSIVYWLGLAQVFR